MNNSGCTKQYQGVQYIGKNNGCVANPGAKTIRRYFICVLVPNVIQMSMFYKIFFRTQLSQKVMKCRFISTVDKYAKKIYFTLMDFSLYNIIHLQTK